MTFVFHALVGVFHPVVGIFEHVLFRRDRYENEEERRSRLAR